MDTFAQIAAERRDLAELIDALSDEQLTTTSLCEGWTVRDVAAHLVMPLVTPMRSLAWEMVKARGSFDQANLVLTRRVADRGDDLAGALRAHATSRFTPPGAPPEAPLTDLLIHGQDIRRPLRLAHAIDPDRLRLALNFLITPAARRGFVPSWLPADIRWVADDLGIGYGEGPEVRGSGEAIMLALSGRRASLTELSGDGVAALIDHA